MCGLKSVQRAAGLWQTGCCGLGDVTGMGRERGVRLDYEYRPVCVM